MSLKRMALVICVMTLLCGCIFSQSITGTLTGTFTDSSGAAVPGVQVSAKNLNSGAVRQTVSGPEGIFVFNSLEPARYNVTAKATGFKSYESDNIDVVSSSTRDLGKLALSLGAITDNITVTAAATPVQTASSENAKLVDSDQIADLTLKGRDLWAILTTIPGVYMGNNYLTGGDASSESTALQTMSINGGGNSRSNFTVDGITDLDTGSNATSHYEPTMDTIAEVRVLTTNYQAEFGRNSSGTISVVTKGGSQEFHGSAYANKRHEMFNAKSFFFNLNNQQKAIYRFFVWGYSIGGPVYIPKVFNTQKKKLFFFFSQEYTKQKPAVQTGLGMVPTPAQEAGNFADRCVANSSPCTPALTDGNGVSRTLRDPTTGNSIAGGYNLNNLIGTAYYDKTSAGYGQAMLAFDPPPNICTAAAGILNNQAISPSNCPSGYSNVYQSSWNYNYNLYWAFNETHPRRNDTLRFDYNLTSKLSTWARWINDYDLDDTNGGLPQKNSAGQWVPFSSDHPNPGHGWGVGITYTISPTMVNEFTFGKSYNSWSYYPHDASQIARSNMNNPPSFDNFATDQNFITDQGQTRPDMSTPGSQNYLVGIPAVTYGGSYIPNEANPAQGNCGGVCPYTNFNDIYSFNDAVSKVQGKHNLKAGLYVERTGKVQYSGQGNYMGSYNFQSNVAMSQDTTDGFANAWLGNFNNYSEGTRVIGNYWFTQIEAFVQDNWRVSRKLTVDVGLRLYDMQPIEDLNTGSAGGAVWLRSTYNSQTPERIYYPGCTIVTTTSSCPGANEYAYDAATGYKTFYALQGTMVPASVGGYGTATPTPFPGMTVAGTSALPLGLYTPPSLSPAFRFGFAYDVFGNGKTAIRGGFGQFLNRGDFNQISGYVGQQPLTVNQTVYYSPINSLVTNKTALLQNAAVSPISPGSDFVGNQPYESAYNGSFMIQQNVGFSTVLEASWIFNLRRHVPATTPINYQPSYDGYNSQWVNPTVPQGLLNPATNGGLTQGNANGLDLSANYFYGTALMPGCATCVFGLGNLSASNFDMSSDTHSLQITIRRNMTKHLSYGLSYTFLKTMNTFGNGGNGNVGSHSGIFPDKFRNFGPQYLPTPQVLAINYVYEAPNLGQKLNFKPLGYITDHWTWSGITQWRSDAMAGIPGLPGWSGTNSSTDPTENWTAGSEGARMFVVGDYRLSSIGQSAQHNGLGAGAIGTQSAPITGGQSGNVAATTGYGANGSAGNQLINEAAWRIPYPCSKTAAANPIYGVGQSMECFGNAGGGNLINVPGTRILNFDMTFSKNFPLKSEKRVLMFRAEMYNIFNHTMFTNWNLGPNYDWNNWKNGVLVQTSNNLGRYNGGTANPRQMSMSLRFQF